MGFTPAELQARKAKLEERKKVAALEEGSTIFGTEPVGKESTLENADSTNEVAVSVVEETQRTNTELSQPTIITGETRHQEEADKLVSQATVAPKEVGSAGEESTEDSVNQASKLEGQMSEIGITATKGIPDETELTLTSETTLADTSVFQNLTNTSETSGIDGNDSYAELVENMVSAQCQMSGVKNLDLTTFGLRAQVLSFPNLTVMEYGIHKFLGAPFTEEEENIIIHRLGLHVAQSNKDKIVVRAVQEVKDSRGMSFYSLLFNENIAQRFANMFNYTVHANLKESDVSKLVLVIQK